MNLRRPLPLLLPLLLLPACTVIKNPDGSITFKSQTRFEADTAVTRESTRDITASDTILVENGNGAIDVQAKAGLTKIRLSTKAVAFADEADGENAKKAIADVETTIELQEVGNQIVVRCGQASQKYGTAAEGTTGCGTLTVEVPADGITLAVDAKNGTVDVTGVTAREDGTVDVRSDNGSITAAITPSKGSIVAVRTENGDATLSVPSGFSADLVTVTGSAGKVDTSAFPGLESGKAHGTAGAGAASVEVSSAFGAATLKAL